MADVLRTVLKVDVDRTNLDTVFSDIDKLTKSGNRSVQLSVSVANLGDIDKLKSTLNDLQSKFNLGKALNLDVSKTQGDIQSLKREIDDLTLSFRRAEIRDLDPQRRLEGSLTRLREIGNELKNLTKQEQELAAQAQAGTIGTRAVKRKTKQIFERQQELEAERAEVQFNQQQLARRTAVDRGQAFNAGAAPVDTQTELIRARNVRLANRAITQFRPEQNEFFEEEVANIRKQFNLGAGTQLRGQARGFQAERLNDPHIQEQLAFSLLFGKLPGFIGGSLAAGFGQNVNIGSALGTGAFDLLIAKPLELAKERSAEFKEAGLANQRSIAGISAVRSAQFDVVSPNGQIASPLASLGFQQIQAREIQQAARAQLLPLGIAGATEGTFVQGVTSALGSRGLQANAQQTARIAALFGGAIQSQRPGLLDNTSLLLRDLEDVISGGPNAGRTVLGNLAGVKQAVPQLRRAGSAEEFVAILERTLGAFEKAAVGLENPSVTINKLAGALDNLKTVAGTEILGQLAPALKDLFEVLKAPETIAAAQKLGSTIGALEAAFVKADAAAIKYGANFINNPGQAAAQALPGIVEGGLGAAALFALFRGKGTGLTKAIPGLSGLGGELGTLVSETLFGKTVLPSFNFGPGGALTGRGATGVITRTGGLVPQIGQAFGRFGTAASADIASFAGPELASLFANVFKGANGLFGTGAGGGLTALRGLGGVLATKALPIVNALSLFDLGVKGARGLYEAGIDSDQAKQEQLQKERIDLTRSGVGGLSERANASAQFKAQLNQFGLTAELEKAEAEIPANLQLAGAKEILRTGSARKESIPVLFETIANKERERAEADIKGRFNLTTTEGQFGAIGARQAAESQRRATFQEQLDAAQANLAEVKSKESRTTEAKDLQVQRYKALQELSENKAQLGIRKTALRDLALEGKTGTTEYLEADIAAKKQERVLKDSAEAVLALDEASEGLKKGISPSVERAKGSVLKAMDNNNDSFQKTNELAQERLSNIRKQISEIGEGIDQSTAFGRELTGRRQFPQLQELVLGAQTDQQRQIAENQVFGNIRSRAQAGFELGQIPLEGIQRGNAAGRAQFGAANAANQEALNQSALNRVRFFETQLRENPDDDAIRSALGTARVDLVKGNVAQRQIQFQNRFETPFANIQQPLQANKSILDLNQAFEALKTASESLKLTFENARESLAKFGREAELRALGRKGEEIAAGEAVLQAGGSFLDIDADTARSIENKQDFGLDFAKAKYRAVRENNRFDRVGTRERTEELGLEQKQSQAENALNAGPVNEQLSATNAAFDVLQKYRAAAEGGNENSPLAKLLRPQAETALGGLNKLNESTLAKKGEISGLSNNVTTLEDYLGLGPKGSGAIEKTSTEKEAGEAAKKLGGTGIDKIAEAVSDLNKSISGEFLKSLQNSYSQALTQAFQ